MRFALWGVVLAAVVSTASGGHVLFLPLFFILPPARRSPHAARGYAARSNPRSVQSSPSQRMLRPGTRLNCSRRPARAYRAPKRALPAPAGPDARKAADRHLRAGPPAPAWSGFRVLFAPAVRANRVANLARLPTVRARLDRGRGVTSSRRLSAESADLTTCRCRTAARRRGSPLSRTLGDARDPIIHDDGLPTVSSGETLSALTRPVGR